MNLLKKILLFLYTIFLCGCGDSSTNIEQRVGPGNMLSRKKVMDSVGQIPGACISRTDAEMILGQPANIVEISFDSAVMVGTNRCAYKAIKKDTITGKTGMLHYVMEQYDIVPIAKRKFKQVFDQNKTSTQFTAIKGIGNEGFLQSVDQNYYMIIVRRDHRILRIKVNEITSFTSIDALKKVAGRIMAESE